MSPDQSSYKLMHSQIYKLLLAGFFLLGIVTAFVLPPFQVPDEIAHWKTAITRAESLLHGPSASICSMTLGLSEAFDAARIIGNRDQKMQSGALGRVVGVRSVCDRVDIYYGNVATYWPVLLLNFLPMNQHLLPVRALQMFHLARLLGGLGVFLLLWRLSVVAMRRFERPVPGLLTIAAICLSPLFVQQSFAVSSDIVINMAALATAIVFLSGSAVRVSDLLIFLVLGLIAGDTKHVMAPLFLTFAWAGLLVFNLPVSESRPQTTWRSRIFPNRQSYMLAAVGMLLTLSCLASYAFHVDYQTFQPPAIAGLSIPKQMEFMQAHPLKAFSAFWGRIQAVARTEWWVGPLGWLDAPVSKYTEQRWLGLLGLALVIDIGLVSQYFVSSYKRLVKRAAATVSAHFIAYVACGMAIFASMLATCAAMYVICTPVGAKDVMGVQQRYFFPHALLLAALFFPSVKLAPAGGDKEIYSSSREWLRPWGFKLLLLLITVIAACLLTGLYFDLARRYW